MQNGLLHKLGLTTQTKLAVTGMALLGLALYWDFFFSSILFNEPLSVAVDKTGSASLAIIAFLVGSIGALLIANLAADLLVRTIGRRFLMGGMTLGSVVVLFLSVRGYLLANGGANTLLVILTFMLIGLMASFCLLVWLEYLAGKQRQLIALIVAGSTVLGGLLFAATNLLEPLPRSVVLSFLPLASMLVSSLLRISATDSRTSAKVAGGELQNRAQTAAELVLYPGTSVFIAVYGAVFGLGIALLLRTQAGTVSFLANAVCVVMAGLVMCVALVRGADSMILGRAQKFIYPLIIVGIAPLSFVDGPLRVGCLLLLLTCFICFDLAHLASLLASPEVARTAFFYVASRARLPLVGGLFAGVLLDRLLMLLPLELADQTAQIITVVVFVVIMALLIAFVPLEPDRLRTQKSPKTVESSGPTRRQRKCEALGRDHDLTSREIEVLELLSRGHGSRYVQEKLYISEGTVKTHQHNIYVKLGVATREDLLALFEKE